MLKIIDYVDDEQNLAESESSRRQALKSLDEKHYHNWQERFDSREEVIDSLLEQLELLMAQSHKSDKFTIIE